MRMTTVTRTRRQQRSTRCEPRRCIQSRGPRTRAGPAANCPKPQSSQGVHSQGGGRVRSGRYQEMRDERKLVTSLLSARSPTSIHACMPGLHPCVLITSIFRSPVCAGAVSMVVRTGCAGCCCCCCVVASATMRFCAEGAMAAKRMGPPIAT